jgi:hypothetical protein
VKAALKRVRAAMDADYPTIRKPVAKRAGKLAPGHRENRLRRDGYVPTDALYDKHVAILRAAGWRVIDDPRGDRRVWVRSWMRDMIELMLLHVPVWAREKTLASIARGTTRSKTKRIQAEAKIYCWAARSEKSKRKSLINAVRANPEVAASILAVGRALHTQPMAIAEAIDAIVNRWTSASHTSAASVN